MKAWAVYVQLHVPFPSELSAPSLRGSKDAVEDMLITAAVLKLVEPFARRSDRLESDIPSMQSSYPLLDNDSPGSHCKSSDPNIKNQMKIRRTVKDALNIDVKYIIPSFLLWEIVERASPSDTSVVHENMNIVFTLTEFSNESITACL